MSCGPRGSQNLLTDYEMEKPYLQWFQSSADPSSLLQSKNIAHTFLAVQSNPKSNASHVPPKKNKKHLYIPPSHFPPATKHQKEPAKPHTNHQTCCFLLLSHSISLLATPLNLYGHSQHRHPALLSPQTPTFGIGETVRLTSRYHLLGMYLLEFGFLAHFTSYMHTCIPTYLLHTSREMCDTWVSVLLRANGEKQKNKCSCWLWHALYLD